VGGEDGAARAALTAALAAGPAVHGEPPVLGPLLAEDREDAAYRRGFEAVARYLVAGDAYQVNLARRLVAAVERGGDPLALYQRLARRAPAPMGALIEPGDGLAVLCNSPERFLHRAPGGDRIETRPIKGTRRRAGDTAADARRAAELRADPKELAEHLMIVDLERNDLGRVARTGTVTVDSFARVVELPTVLHLVSTVSCRVERDLGVAALLAATFPGGSITGAPKLRAMEIIAELEPAPRGVYTGALGYLGQGGALDLAIAIRTGVLHGARLTLGVGGGLVADSTLARELEETEEKASAWRAALA
jgi:para-aminobenzoate synthetase component I